MFILDHKQQSSWVTLAQQGYLDILEFDQPKMLI